jgi:FtsH-binding integral membrane protein
MPSRDQTAQAVQANRFTLTLLTACAGMAVALQLGRSLAVPFCWLTLPFFIVGATAFRHLPHLRKRWKAALVVLYLVLGGMALGVLTIMVIFQGIH